MMNPEAEQLLRELFDKHIDDLTEEEKGFIKARRSYLNEEQLKRYESFLVEAPVEKPLEKMTLAELQEKAASLELPTEGTKAQLKEAIETALAA